MTQRTVLNTDLGADSCEVHIVENGTIEPEEKDYIKWMKIIHTANIHRLCLHLGNTCISITTTCMFMYLYLHHGLDSLLYYEYMYKEMRLQK